MPRRGMAENENVNCLPDLANLVGLVEHACLEDLGESDARLDHQALRVTPTHVVIGDRLLDLLPTPRIEPPREQVLHIEVRQPDLDKLGSAYVMLEVQTTSDEVSLDASPELGIGRRLGQGQQAYELVQERRRAGVQAEHAKGVLWRDSARGPCLARNPTG